MLAQCGWQASVRFMETVHTSIFAQLSWPKHILKTKVLGTKPSLALNMFLSRMNTQPKEKKKPVQKESHPTLATFYFLFDSFDIISEYVRSDLSLA